MPKKKGKKPSAIYTIKGQENDIHSLPAYCENCHRWFQSPLIGMKNNTSVFLDIRIGCPFCGSSVAMHGLYKYENNFLSIFNAAGASTEEFKRLLSLLTKAKIQGSPFEEVAKTINEELPKFRAVVESLEKNKPSNAAQWSNNLLVLIILIIGYVYPQSAYEKWKKPIEIRGEAKSQIKFKKSKSKRNSPKKYIRNR